jgi:hypothetical protein
VRKLRRSGYLDVTGGLVPLRSYSFAPGWSNIAFCNRRLVFFNDRTGLMDVSAIGRRGEFTSTAQSALPPGGAHFTSDGTFLTIEQANHWWTCQLGRGGLEVVVDGGYAPGQARPYPRSVRAGGCDMTATYRVDYRMSASLAIWWRNPDGERHWDLKKLLPCQIVAHTDWDPNWTDLALSNGFALFYDWAVGGGQVLDLSPAYVGSEPMLRTHAVIQPSWTHLVPIGSRLLFYATYDGSAASGYIRPDGIFSGERPL